ncbi:MAG: peptidase M52 [Armatimonadota bacterium]|nr:MAG: peptidase M52 [Armatimonadota bacterium]
MLPDLYHRGSFPLPSEIDDAMKRRGTLLIGIGNPYRQDDGAGIAAVRRLRYLLPETIQCLECTGDLTTLLDAWQGYERVILIDAMHSGRAAGEVVHFEVSRQPLPANTRFSSTHAMGLNEMLALAHALNQVPPELVIYGIEGQHFGEGEGLSPEVAKAVEDVVRYILEDLTKGEGDA